MKIAFVAESVVAAKPVDVTSEGRKVGAGKLLGSRTRDDFHHPKNVGIHVFQVSAVLKVTKKSQSPARLDESVPTWLGTLKFIAQRIISYVFHASNWKRCLISCAHLSLVSAAIASSIRVIGRYVYIGAYLVIKYIKVFNNIMKPEGIIGEPSGICRFFKISAALSLTSCTS